VTEPDVDVRPVMDVGHEADAQGHFADTMR